MRFFADHRRGPRKHLGTFKTEAVGRTSSSAGKLYYEQDNAGIRQETMAQAIAYWKKERPALSDRQPFTLFTFSSADAAEEALLALPFFHKAADSGKLICDRMMTYGCYETKRRGVRTGQYEVMITGSDLTQAELFFAERAFSGHNGRCKTRNVPCASAASPAEGGNATLVRYSETIKGSDGVSTYEVYNGPDRASALAFLKEKTVVKRLFYMIVDTPEGSFGRDFVGLYQE